MPSERSCRLCRCDRFFGRRLGLAPATEDQAAQSEAQAEGSDCEGADRERLSNRREPLPAAENLLLLGGERLTAALLAERAAGPQAEVEVVEDLGRFFSHRTQCIAWVRRCPCGSSTSRTCTPEARRKQRSSANCRL